MNNKTILITGGYGYIGKICSFQLQKYGYNVCVLDDLSNYNSSLGIENFDTTNLLEIDSVRKFFSIQKVDAVIHLASFIQVSESVQQPLRYYNNNIVGLINLLQVMKENDVDKLIFSSSAAVYGQTIDLPLTESSHTLPINPYGHSKLMGERIIMDMATLGLKSIVFRLFNVAGAVPEHNLGECHEPETHLIPLTVERFLKNQAIYIYGDNYSTNDGTCIRDYIHVLDVVEAFHHALNSLFNEQGMGIYNLGSSIGTSVLEVINQTAKLLNIPTNIVWKDKRSGDPSRLLADTTKMRNTFTWEPRHSTLENIIGSSIEYKRTNI